MTRIAVIGAGVGGLVAASLLASAGHEVEVFEAGPRPGGKAGEARSSGVTFDTGPSVLTLPEVFEQVFEACGERLSDHVTLRTLDPAFRYVWPDGTALDVRHHPGDTLRSTQEVLGPDAAEDLAGFLDYARGIWDAAAPRFVFAPAPGVRTLLELHPRDLVALARAEPLSSMSGSVRRRVRSPHLRDVLERYATYNGSDPRAAPATLNCIAHVELALGGYGVQGGIHEIARALAKLAERHGARIHLNAPVRRIALEGRRVRGLELAAGEHRPFDAVVCNADVAHLAKQLLPDARPSRQSPSTSGWTAVVRSTATPIAPHVVAFNSRYTAEFEDLFDEGTAPRDPTVYACDQHLAHGRATWPDGSRPVFLMANAPAEPTEGISDPATWPDLRERVLRRATSVGLIHGGDAVVWERSPTGLAEAFPDSRGALYGAASNSVFSAFKRPANRHPSIRGLYLATGSAHPGGGLPLVAMSGRLAAEALVDDLGRK